MADDLQAKIDEITQRYQPEIDGLEAEGERIESEAGDPNSGELMVGIDFDVEWKRQEMSFDVPTVTMRTRKLSLDLPRVTKKLHRIVFDIPTVTMERWCAFKRPVFRWPRVRMECVYMDKPVVRMKKHEVKTDIPQVRMERKEFSLDVPEFGTRTLEISLNIPQFTARNIRVEAKKLEEKGEALKARGEELATRMEAEIQAAVKSFLGSFSTDDNDVRHAVDGEFANAIGAFEASIAELSAQNIDASKVPAEEGNINLRKTLTDLMDQRDSAIQAIGTPAPQGDGEAGSQAEPVLEAVG